MLSNERIDLVLYELQCDLCQLVDDVNDIFIGFRFIKNSQSVSD